MMLLVLKLVFAPLLVAAATLAQRRWGPGVGGRLVGLPLTAGPLLALLAVSDGSHFAARVATSDQAGDVAASAWCVVYALVARRRRPTVAAVAAFAAFAAVATGLARMAFDPVTATLAASAALVALLVWWPAPSTGEAVRRAGGDDLLLRMVVAAGFTFALSESAATLGATAAGLTGALPLVTIILTVATHHRQGSAAANRFLLGVMSGSFSVIGFLAVVSLTLPILPVGAAFGLGLAAAVAAQVVGARRQRATAVVGPVRVAERDGELCAR